MTEEKLDFDNEPEDFPQVWESGEDAIQLKIDEIINKHVYLAFKEYMADECWFLMSPVIFEPGGKTVCEFTFGLGDHWQRDFNPEAEADRILRNMYSPEQFIGMAESLERCAATLREKAKTAPKDENEKVSG